jgi:hypothetical protein
MRRDGDVVHHAADPGDLLHHVLSPLSLKVPLDGTCQRHLAVVDGDLYLFGNFIVTPERSDRVDRNVSVAARHRCACL